MVITVDTSGQSRQVAVQPGHRDLTTELRRAGIALNTRCGGVGLCDGCMVEPLAGRFEHRTSGLVIDGRYAGSIRACQYRVLPTPDARIRIPQRSTLTARAAVERDFALAGPASLAPIWRQLRRDGHWVVEQWHAGAFRETSRRPDPVDRPLGLAIDVGTTTVAILLVDLATGDILDRNADFNHQITLGDNVLTRIGLCLSDPTMLTTLQRAVIDQTILPLVRQSLQRTGRNEGSVVCAAISGNTTMLHLISGVDPSPLGVAPFRASFLDHRLEHGLLAPLDATAHILPGASAYVGSDLSAGAIACALHDDHGPTLLVDVGTNGEMILRHGDRLFGCATAAGPAFEGSGLTSGIRASDGAVAHIRFFEGDPWFEIDTINQARPVGLCGSFYIDFLAQAKRVGLLDETGHFCPGSVPELASRFGRSACGGRTFRVAGPDDDRAVVVSEGDVAKLLAAKAAIAAGMLTLLERHHLTPADLRVLHLAGGFGAKLDLANAVSCGLLPGVDPRRVNVVGNSSLAGAWLALLDVSSLQRMIDLAGQIEIVELNQDPSFEDRYLDHLAC